jgi:hypothetical protein
MANRQNQDGQRFILRKPRDYETWLELKKTFSRKGEVWHWADPEGDGEEYLIAPVRPTPGDVRDKRTLARNQQREKDGELEDIPEDEMDETRFSDLLSPQQFEYNSLLAEWKEEMKLFKEIKAALAELCKEIQETIDRNYLPKTYGCDSAHEMICELRDFLKPSTAATRAGLKSDWSRLAQPQRKGTDIDQWLLELETVFDDCVRYNVAAVVGDGDDPIYEMLNALQPIAPEWTAVMDEKVASGEIDDLKVVLQRFRDYRRNTATRKRVAPAHSAFGASLQGKNPDGTPAENRDQAKGRTRDGGRGRGNKHQSESRTTERE